MARTTRSLILIGTAVVLLFVLLATAYANYRRFTANETRIVTKDKEGRVTVGLQTYPGMDLKAITSKADLIIVGTVKEVLPSRTEYTGGLVTIGKAQRDQAKAQGITALQDILYGEEADQADAADQTYAAHAKDNAEALQMKEEYIEDSTVPFIRKLIKVDSIIKGGAGATVSVRERGGSKDGQTFAISGITQLKVGDKVLFFLETVRPFDFETQGFGSPNGFQITGGSQGKYYLNEGTAIREDSQVTRPAQEVFDEIMSYL